MVSEVEVCEGRFISYSLGNFATYGTINMSGINGYAPLVEVETNRDGKFFRWKDLFFFAGVGFGTKIG